MILAIQHVPHEGMGLLENVLANAAVPYRYLKVYEERDGGASLLDTVDLAKVSGLVVMGGPMGVYEKEHFPFLTREVAPLRSALREELPILGICLGSQLLAEAGGGAVYPGPAKEIGWFPIRLTEEGGRDSLLRHVPKEARVFHWHGDTFDLPPNARLLASSDRYQRQAFRLGKSAWGFQFHLEVTEPMVRSWVEIERAKSPASDSAWNPGEILDQTPDLAPDLEVLAKKVFGEFVKELKPLKKLPA